MLQRLVYPRQRYGILSLASDNAIYILRILEIGTSLIAMTDIVEYNNIVMFTLQVLYDVFAIFRSVFVTAVVVNLVNVSKLCYFVVNNINEMVVKDIMSILVHFSNVIIIGIYKRNPMDCSGIHSNGEPD